jgi:DNA-binding LacI/PurR family transcriptional regulator
VSVLGVDDHEVSRVLSLTTIRQHVASQGAVAARSLIAVMASTPVNLEPVVSPIELVIRSTTGPPA